MAELNTQIEELGRLEDQLQAMGVPIGNAISDGTSNLNHPNLFPPENGYL